MNRRQKDLTETMDRLMTETLDWYLGYQREELLDYILGPRRPNREQKAEEEAVEAGDSADE